MGIGSAKSESKYDKIVKDLAPNWQTAKAKAVKSGGKYSVVAK